MSTNEQKLDRWVVVRESVLDVGFGDDVRTGGKPELGYALISNTATFDNEEEAMKAAADLPLGWVVMPLSRLLPDLADALTQPPAPEQAMPEAGWKLVPVEPTFAMCIAGDNARFNVDDPNRTPSIYRAMLSASPAAPEVAKHPDDEAVDRFALAMKEKLAAARAKGRDGWQTCSQNDLSWMLRDHVGKGDPRDVANFCMFLWNLDHGIAAPTAAEIAERAAFSDATEAAKPEQPSGDHDFKNFHRLLCERFDYVHDEKDWKRDQLSLIEWIAKKVATPTAEPGGERAELIAALQRASKEIARAGHNGWGNTCEQAAAMLAADGKAGGEFGTFVERSDGSTEFRCAGVPHTPTPLAYTVTYLYTRPQQAAQVAPPGHTLCMTCDGKAITPLVDDPERYFPGLQSGPLEDEAGPLAGTVQDLGKKA